MLVVYRRLAAWLRAWAANGGKPAACTVVVAWRPNVFLMRPISLAMRLAAVALLLLSTLPNLRKQHAEAFVEAET